MSILEEQLIMEWDITVRAADAQDIAVLGEVMYDAVRNGPSLYTEKQRAAWVPRAPSGSAWEDRLAAQTILVAGHRSQVVGFISATADGYIDLAFVRSRFQRMGIFGMLYQEYEDTARQGSGLRIWVRASLMAQSAFRAVGFRTLREEIVEVRSERLRCFEMEKYLRNHDSHPLRS